MTDVLLTVGTRKGLFIGRRRGGTWEFDGPHFNAQAVYSIGIDTRGPVPRLLVGGDSAHWGPSVFHSDDLKATEANIDRTNEDGRYPSDHYPVTAVLVRKVR